MSLISITGTHLYEIGRFRCTNAYKGTNTYIDADTKVGVLGKCFAPPEAMFFRDGLHKCGIIRLCCRHHYHNKGLLRALCPWCLPTLPWFLKSIKKAGYFVIDISIVSTVSTESILHLLSIIDKINIEV